MKIKWAGVHNSPWHTVKTKLMGAIIITIINPFSSEKGDISHQCYTPGPFQPSFLNEAKIKVQN